MKKNGIDVIEDYIPKSNKTSRPGYKMDPKYITIHNTGNSKKSANAKMHTEYVDRATGYISWHYTVGDKAIYKELPTNETAWHAGDGNGLGNRQSIGIEITENIDGDYNKAEENAIALIAFLMEEHNIPIENVVPHQRWSGKYCPHIILNYGWDKFIDKINDYLDPIPKVLSSTKIMFEGNEISGLITDEGKSYAEVRKLAELLGLLVEWNSKTKTVTLKRRG